MTGLENVFVYGTLKQGHANNGLMRNSELIEQEAYVKDMSLINARAYPFAIDKKNSFLLGELYRVTKERMKLLDSLEGYPTMYNRKKVEVYEVRTGYRIGTAWIYFIDDKNSIERMSKQYALTNYWPNKGNKGEKLFV